MVAGRLYAAAVVIVDAATAPAQAGAVPAAAGDMLESLQCGSEGQCMLL